MVTKSCSKLRLGFLSLFFALPAYSSENVPEPKPSPAIISAPLSNETWAKRTLMFEPSFSFPLVITSRTLYWGANLDAWYMLSSDWAVGVGAGVLSMGQLETYASLSGQARYYLPYEISQQLEIPLGRFYLEGKLTGLMKAGAASDFRLSLAPQIGLELLSGGIQTRIYTGLQLSPGNQDFFIQPFLGFGPLNFSTIFDANHSDQYLQAYQTTLNNLNHSLPKPRFRLSSGISFPEGLDSTLWLNQAHWGFGFSKSQGLNSTEAQIGLKLRYYWSPERFGGMGYVETIASTAGILGLGARIGYEYRPAEWMSLEASIGPGIYARHPELLKFSNVENQKGPWIFMPTFFLGITFSLPVPMAEVAGI